MNTHLPIPPAPRSVLTLAALTGSLLAAGCSESAPTAPRLSPGEPSADRATPTFTFTAIDVPNALLTSAQGINAGGMVAGFYVDANSHSHGFILSGGAFTTIDYPGAANTSARGIGPDGDVVGTHSNQGEEAVAAHGYRRSSTGEFSPVHFPGHLYEVPQRILPDGTILGCRHDHDLMSSMRGMTISRNGASDIDAFASMNNGATPDGHRTIGLYTNMMAGHGEGYLIDNGEFTPLLFPGSTSTAAWDINARGDIVGVYVSAGAAHGWIRASGEFTTINYPGATATRVFGVNSRGDVVGAYVAAGKTHGFVGTRMQ